MKLWIANCINQRQMVYYRLDFNDRGEHDVDTRRRGAISQPIEIAGQIILGGDLKHTSQAQSIMDQLSRVGAVGVEELNRLPKHKIPLIMSIDKPVPTRAILAIANHNKGILTAEGKQRRANAAVASNEIVEKAIQANVKDFTLEIEQQPNDPDEPPPSGKPLDEGLRVTPTAPPPSNRRGNRRPSA